MALMFNAVTEIPKPENTPFVGYQKGSKERDALVLEIRKLRERTKSQALYDHCPLWINGPVVASKELLCRVPHDNTRILGTYSAASERHVVAAIDTVLNARERWSQIPWWVRMHIFRTAARLIETKYRHQMVAAVMEDYSKSPFEASIDVEELIDFLNFNTYYAYLIYQEQPDSNRDTLNMLDCLPLEGFVFSVSPNNFIAINGNLCTAPLIMGNVVVAKPSSDVVYSFNLFLKILLEARLPHDVMSVLYGDSKMIGEIVMNHRMFSGVHFTGGTDTFNAMWGVIGNNVASKKYRIYPEIVGETGGKDAILVRDDANPQQTAISIAVGAFGAQGRKCSSTSRVYMTLSMWSNVRPPLHAIMYSIRVGDVADFRNFMGAVINEREYGKILKYINEARVLEGKGTSDDVWEVVGHETNQTNPPNGWFIRPTVIVTGNPKYRTMEEEIFGPVVTVCVLRKERFEKEAVSLFDETSEYGLTGAVQTNDVFELCEMLHKLRFAVGNMYDDRTTAAMVNLQPFSGLRMSGTDSKVGWIDNLRHWTRKRTVGLRASKTTFPPPYLDKE